MGIAWGVHHCARQNTISMPPAIQQQPGPNTTNSSTTASSSTQHQQHYMLHCFLPTLLFSYLGSTTWVSSSGHFWNQLVPSQGRYCCKDVVIGDLPFIWKTYPHASSFAPAAFRVFQDRKKHHPRHTHNHHVMNDVGAPPINLPHQPYITTLLVASLYQFWGRKHLRPFFPSY